MKKIQEILKPKLLIIFGTLMFLLYIGGIKNDDAKFLVLAIFGIVFAAYYITVGILNVSLGDRLNASAKQFFDILNVSLFAFLILYQTIVGIVAFFDISPDLISTAGWIINIYAIMAAGGLIVMVILAKTGSKAALDRLAFMFAVCFGLALLLMVLFDEAGNASSVASIIMVEVALYGFFIPIMLNAVGKAKNENE